MDGRWKWIAAVAGLTLVLATAERSAANGVIRDGVGAVSSGRGGTNIAHSDNGAIVLDNPAGMMGVSGRGLTDISLDGLITNLNYEDPFTADTAPIRPMGLPMFGWIRKSQDEQWAYGLAVTAPAGFAAHFNLSDPVFGPDNKYSSFGALVKVLPGLACQVTDRLTVGATAGLGISRATLHGPYWIQSGLAAVAPTVLDFKGSGAAFVWSLGAQYQLTEDTTIGMTYLSESRFRLDGNASAIILPGGPIFSEFDADLDITWPRSVGVGITHQVNCCHRLSSDLIWINWEDAFDSFGVTLKNPSNPLVPPLFGGATVVGDQFPLQWRNSLSVRLGYEFFPTECSVWRAGYAYNMNQIPDGTLTPFIPATLEHTVTCGWGGTRGDFSLDIAYQFMFGPERQAGTSHLVGGDFTNSNYESQAHWLNIALTRRF